MLVKICGVQSSEIAQAVAEGGADFMGFIFAPSRRAILPEKASVISKTITGVKKVGVFVNAPSDEVNSIAELCDLDYVQLHGDESPLYCKSIKRPIIKAFRYQQSFSADEVNRYDVEMVLIDSYQPNQMGGTGKVFQWSEAKAELQKIRCPVLAAGGLTIGNVKQAMEILQPDGIDISGGVEENGEKSVKKIREFLTYINEIKRRI
ncbi:phosphoribosylanthranilate isomerase [Anaerosinus massiliensis]|uniref:phosphoribosylanthranilate isomerase n=1 Tax=Massilibacillus massiliensis TaxID=1806837 RepID=UPI000A3DCBD1|nr:phosphoribosylanthranilate isomerase [Massilibacillus massiliensis]